MHLLVCMNVMLWRHRVSIKTTNIICDVLVKQAWVYARVMVFLHFFSSTTHNINVPNMFKVIVVKLFDLQCPILIKPQVWRAPYRLLRASVKTVLYMKYTWYLSLPTCLCTSKWIQSFSLHLSLSPHMVVHFDLTQPIQHATMSCNQNCWWPLKTINFNSQPR